MPTPHEAILDALMAELETHAADVIQEEELPQVCPANGLINLVPEDPVEAGVSLGTGAREWSRQVGLEVIVKHEDAASRRNAIEDALVQLAGLITGSSLGGTATYLLIGPPERADDIPMAGAVDLRGAVVSVTLFYETSDNPMETLT
ncbi:hypothetical protein [Pseudophaeobacter sp.]|jgi:hypothetical protein|uniref:hypothetical protein n=1 Tax=Pseudophaeobacter sp. TaxID=1971739 RepID=UPI0032638974